jgi:hypothetical protein
MDSLKAGCIFISQVSVNTHKEDVGSLHSDIFTYQNHPR